MVGEKLSHDLLLNSISNVKTGKNSLPLDPTEQKLRRINSLYGKIIAGVEQITCSDSHLPIIIGITGIFRACAKMIHVDGDAEESSDLLKYIHIHNWK